MASPSGGGSVWGSKSALVHEAGVVDFEAELRAVLRMQYAHAEDGKAKWGVMMMMVITMAIEGLTGARASDRAGERANEWVSG